MRRKSNFIFALLSIHCRPPSDIFLGQQRVENVTLVPRNYSSLHVMSAKIRAYMLVLWLHDEGRKIKKFPFRFSLDFDERKERHSSTFTNPFHDLSCIQSIRNSLKYIHHPSENLPFGHRSFLTLAFVDANGKG